MWITYINFFNKKAWENYRTNLVGLIKERSESKFIIGYICKFKVF